MKRLTQLGLVMAVVLAVALTVTMAMPQDKQEPIKGEKVSISGMLSCTFCTFAHPDKTCKKGCCTECLKAGDPPLLKDAEGNMYLLLTSEIKKPLMTPERMDMTGEKVMVKGMLVKGKGLQAIFVDSMEKAQAKEGEKKPEPKPGEKS